MDTKWKKSKTAAGILSFGLGLCLLAGCALVNPLFVCGGRAELSALARTKGSYQETEAFRNEITNSLNQLMAVGTGKEQDYYYSGGAYEGNWWGLPGRRQTVSVTAENTAVAAAEGDAVVEISIVQEADSALAAVQAAEGRAGWYSGEGQAVLTKKQTERIRESLLAEYGGNRNLLFLLEKDGEPVFDNLGGSSLSETPDGLPEGYNFLLVFDGKEFSVFRDGAETDVYGDGMYETDGLHWRLPGYENYQLPEGWEKCRAILAAREIPVRTMENGSLRGGTFYSVYENYRSAQKYLLEWCLRLALGCALLLLSLVWKRQRRAAGERLGVCLGRIPLEIGLVLTGLWLCLAYGLLFTGLVWGYVGDGTLSALQRMGDAFSLALVSGIWLIGCRIKYGGELKKNSLIGKLYGWAKKREWKLDVQERIAGRVYRPLWLLIAGLGSFGIGYLDQTSFGLGIGEYLIVFSAAALLAVLVLLLYNEYRQWRLAADLGRLSDQIDAAFGGKEGEDCELPADSDLFRMAQKVAGIRDGLEEAVEERMKSERMKVELVANVSHDIKTPLTSIISYVDLLREDDSLPEELKDYVAILAQKAERLKEMVQDVFEVSKAASGQLPVQTQPLDLAKLLRQTLADMQEQIDAAPVMLKAQLPDEEVEIRADGQRLYRVFQNLVQNALQYSLEGSRIYVRLERQGRLAAASVRNISKEELDQTVDFTERFVRGDKSRTDGGSGLGLSIARSFTEACGGTFRVETIADLFVVTVEFETVER